MKRLSSTSLLAVLAFAVNANAGSDLPPLEQTPISTEPTTDWWDDSNDWSLFDGKITASLYGNIIYGGTTGVMESLYGAGHDPKRDEGWTVQGLEPGISLRLTDHIEGFASGILFTDGDGEWDTELEELFGVVRDLPGGIDIRFGQMLNRVGIQNTHHLHSWDQTDSPMVIARFLGEDGLITRSAELNWRAPIGDPLTSTTQFTASYGEVRPHDAHGHGKEHGDEHGDEHGAAFEAEGAEFNDRVFSARVMHRKRFDDFTSITLGGNYLYGDNEFGRNNQIGGLDVEYVWRENGLEPGGRALRWRSELFVRDVAARSGELHEEHDDHEDDDHVEHDDDHADDGHDEAAEMISRSFTEFGAYTSVVYEWNSHWDTGLRIGYVGGISELGLDERFRISPSVTYYPMADRRFHIRGQYNFDHGSEAGSDHSVWIQAGFSFGAGNEVR